MNNIFTDPVAWSEKSVGTFLRCASIMVAHVLIVVVIFRNVLALRLAAQTSRHDHVFLLLGFILVMPLLFVYAARRLLLELKKTDS